MNELVIQDISSQPDDLLRFPDFILGAMARRGIGSLEASLGSATDDSSSVIPFTYYSRITHTSETLAEIPRKNFRPILARLAFRCGTDPYSGQALFAIQWPISGSPVPHRFSIFLCNEPTMAFWVRIYLYGIDGIYPTFGSGDT